MDFQLKANHRTVVREGLGSAACYAMNHHSISSDRLLCLRLHLCSCLQMYGSRSLLSVRFFFFYNKVFVKSRIIEESCFPG